jgi:hypothetical protein
MVYITGNIPSGTYDPTRLANLSFGYVAVDAGGGYTYFDPKTGREFSVAAGKDLAVENRPDGWTAWVTFALSPKAPEPPPAATVSRKY